MIKIASSNLRGYNVDIADGRNLLITQLRWGHVPCYTNTYELS
jgi:hypothetical protein